MALLGLVIIGFGFAFHLVFSAGPFSREEGASGPGPTSASATHDVNGSVASNEDTDDDIEFGSVPISLFRSFTTIVGDFDVETLWTRGSPAVVVFLVALLFGNVVMLNLLIAVVSDEFDKFMERASLEAQLALGGMCKDAREVLQVTSLRLRNSSLS
eukprot:SAG11_NODE_3029_length_2753_cov_8.497739_3_plen_157_part_00